MKREKYKFFSHVECEYFPCHEVDNEEDFNCIFCYCPLYVLGKDCGGNFSYSGNIKDCSKCLIPHGRASYDYIAEKFDRLVQMADRGSVTDEK